MHMAGAPSQLDLFDYKPKLVELNNQKIPESMIKGERFAFIKGVPKLLGTPHEFKRCGKSGAELSDALSMLLSSQQLRQRMGTAACRTVFLRHTLGYQAAQLARQYANA